MAEKTRLAAANLLLGRGVRFKLSGAPLILRLLRLDRIMIRHLKAGTIIALSQIMDEADIGESTPAHILHRKLECLARMIAVAVLNDKYKIRYLSGMLTRILLWKVPADVLLRIGVLVANLNQVSDFTIITTYFAVTAQTMMSPKTRNMVGQQRKGS